MESTSFTNGLPRERVIWPHSFLYLIFLHDWGRLICCFREKPTWIAPIELFVGVVACAKRPCLALFRRFCSAPLRAGSFCCCYTCSCFCSCCREGILIRALWFAGFAIVIIHNRETTFSSSQLPTHHGVQRGDVILAPGLLKRYSSQEWLMCAGQAPSSKSSPCRSSDGTTQPWDSGQSSEWHALRNHPVLKVTFPLSGTDSNPRPYLM